MGLGGPGPAQASKHWSLPLASGRVPLPGVEAPVREEYSTCQRGQSDPGSDLYYGRGSCSAC